MHLKQKMHLAKTHLSKELKHKPTTERETEHPHQTVATATATTLPDAIDSQHRQDDAETHHQIVAAHPPTAERKRNPTTETAVTPALNLKLQTNNNNPPQLRIAKN